MRQTKKNSQIMIRGRTDKGVIPNPLPVLSTEPVLRKRAVDREIRSSTEQYGCRQRSNMILTPLERRKRKF